MKSSRRSLGRSVVFTCLGTLTGAGTGYAAGVLAGILIAIDGAFLFLFARGGLSRQSIADWPSCLSLRLPPVVPGVIAGFFVTLVFLFSRRREFSMAIGAAVAIVFILRFGVQPDADNSSIAFCVVAALAGAFAGMLQNNVLHKLESDD